MPSNLDLIGAKKHYLQVTDDHFEQAAEMESGALQNALQYPAAPQRTGKHAVSANAAVGIVCGPVRNDATPCMGRGSQKVGHTGLEPVTSRV